MGTAETLTPREQEAEVWSCGRQSTLTSWASPTTHPGTQPAQGLVLASEFVRGKSWVSWSPDSTFL